MGTGMSRRGFIGGIGGAAAVGLTGVTAAPAAATGPSRGLPRRGEFTVRGAYVLTMDPKLGDIPGGDVHVRNGRIVAVGKSLKGGGRTVDGGHRVVMPGLVDTHWHMWTTLHRSLAGAGSNPANGYFALNLRHGAVTTPGDIYQGVRLSLADAVLSGITTVHDWSHNIRTAEHADANLRAHAESGLRGRFSYGTPQGHPPDRTIDLADLERVKREWFDTRRAGNMRLGLAGRPPGTAAPEVYRAEFAKARELGLPVSYHANSNRAQGAQAMIRQLGAEGMLGPDTQIIHALFTAPDERALLASSRSPVSVSPWSELLVGYGVTPIHDMEQAGLHLTLSVDTTPLTGTAELFSVMRLTLGLDRGQAEAEFDMSARRVLEMATTDGARALGLGDVTGSLTPDKRADLILVRTDDVNVAPFTDAPNVIALAAAAHNVDTVVADGRVLKRDGVLTAYDPREVVEEASAALRGVLARAGGPAAAAAARVARGDTACCG